MSDSKYKWAMDRNRQAKKKKTQKLKNRKQASNSERAQE